MKFKPEIRHLILIAALVSTVYAEHRLAVWVGWNEWISYVLPGVADLYLIKATKDRKDMTYAILVVVALVSTSYAVTMPWNPVKTIISILVADLAPVVLWRLHITHDHKMELLWGQEAAQAVHQQRDNGWVYEFTTGTALDALRDTESVSEPHGEHCDGNCGMTPDECRVCEKQEEQKPKPVDLTDEQREAVLYDYYVRNKAAKAAGTKPVDAGVAAKHAAEASGVAVATVYRRWAEYKTPVAV